MFAYCDSTEENSADDITTTGPQAPPYQDQERSRAAAIPPGQQANGNPNVLQQVCTMYIQKPCKYHSSHRFQQQPLSDLNERQTQIQAQAGTRPLSSDQQAPHHLSDRSLNSASDMQPQVRAHSLTFSKRVEFSEIVRL